MRDPQVEVNAGLHAQSAGLAPDVIARFEAVAVAFGGVARLNDLSFDIPSTGLLALLGPNGAGKSLSLRVAAGLEQPQTGGVVWQSGTRVAWVAQKPILLRRSVWSNLTFALKLAHYPAARRHERALQLLDMAGLSDRKRQAARSLSGGEQQRLALVRALAGDPHVLLLDEPTASMDPANTRAIEGLIQGVREQGVGLVLVTHDRDQARRLADSVVFLHQGRLIEQCGAGAFFQGPKTPTARAYLAGQLIDDIEDPYDT